MEHPNMERPDMEHCKILTWTVTSEQESDRIDRTLADCIGDYSRSYLQKLIKDQCVLVNGSVVKPSYLVKEADVLTIYLPNSIELNIQPQDLHLDVLYEDDSVIIINKPKDMVVHPSAGHFTGTLVNGILYHCNGQLSGINGVLRPGIVHRIDKDTTGSIVICKTDEAHQSLSDQLKVHSMTRVYHAIVMGHLKEEEGTIHAAIARDPRNRLRMAINPLGKEAITHYKVIQYLKNATYIECRLETGRTHQIRVHMSSIHHPLLGDELYGGTNMKFSLKGQTLHAKTLGFIHPVTKEYLEVDAPLPDYFTKIINQLS